MNDYLNYIEYFIIAFLVTLVISPFVISIIKRENVKQVILHYVESHKSKAGTPTMGGIIFIISITIVSLICFNGNCSYAKMSVAIFLAYGIVGFLDDFIKFRFHRNLGLRAYQKIVFQFSISIIIGFFVYKNLGGVIAVPFLKQKIDIGFWIVPLVAIIYLAVTNSVNLTDGLDGLASSTTLVYFLSFFTLLLVFLNNGFIAENEIMLAELKNIETLVIIACGALFSFLLFNCFPAKIFMGDTGSLALGSLVASVSVFSGLDLYIPILGIVFVASSVSVILQVAYYKLTKKRIFLMAPLHHHFEKKGVHEVRITICYTAVSFLVGLATILINIL